jgi:Ca2+-binding RTX toxin-like protein
VRHRALSLILLVPTMLAATAGAAGASLAREATTELDTQLIYEADPGESNGASVFKSANGQSYLITDGGATIRVGFRCIREFANRARCEASGVTVFFATLDDQADTMDASALDIPAFIGGGNGGDFIIGTPQSETLAGNGGDDFLYGGDAADSLNGQAGDDRLVGQGGDDSLPGGAGVDRISGNQGEDFLWGMDGDDLLFADPGPDLMKGQGPTSCTGGTCTPDAPDIGTDSVSYASFADDVYVVIDGVANDGADNGNEGDNVWTDVENLVGGSGNDRLEGSGGSNTIEGGPGNDNLHGAGGRDFVFGDDGADFFNGGAGPDVYQGGPGRDLSHWLQQPSGFELAGVTVTIDGVANDGNASDQNAAGTRDNVMLDIEDLTGGFGPDDLTGSAATANVIHGFNADDMVEGGEGPCFRRCIVRADTLHGDLGVDTARYLTRNVPLRLTLDGVANDGAAGEDDALVDIENLIGGTNADTMIGDAMANVLMGRGGNDDVTAGDGPDDLRGGPGQDILRGNTSNDMFDAVDGEVDQVFCGADIDTVTADQIDVLSNNCENVTLV